MAANKPTFKDPVSPQSTEFEKDFKKSMVVNNLNIREGENNLNEVDSMLTEVEQSLKKKIFSLAKMESLVFADPKLASVYEEMAENGEEKYGYHYNETIMNMIFNDYVLNSPTYLQKYKQAIPKEKKRRDKSGINKLKKDGVSKMGQSGLKKLEKTDVEESTTAGSAGGAAGYTGYAGPAAWSKKGDLLGNTKQDDAMIRKPIAKVTSISESNYLTDAAGFEKYFNQLNEAYDEDFMSPESQAEMNGKRKRNDDEAMRLSANDYAEFRSEYGIPDSDWVRMSSEERESALSDYLNINEESDTTYIEKHGSNTYGNVDNMNAANQKIIKTDIQTGKLDNNNHIKDGVALQEDGIPQFNNKPPFDDKKIHENDNKLNDIIEMLEGTEIQSLEHEGIVYVKNGIPYSGNNQQPIKLDKNGWKRLFDEYFQQEGGYDGLSEGENNEINPKYSHFAIYKPNGKIINGWEYAGYDTEELKMGKKEYFINDIIDMDFQPRDVNILTSKSLERRGVNPFDINNWYTERFNDKKTHNDNIKEDTQTMIDNNGNSMAFKPQAMGDQGNEVPMGMNDAGGMNESDSKLFEDINKELEAFSIHHDKLKVLAEERKTNSQILNQRVGDENKKNFKKDFNDSDTKETINVEDELMWQDQQTDVGKDPMKLGADIEKQAIKTSDMKGDEALKNVGNSTNGDGDEIPKRNLTTEEQDEVDLYRNGLHSNVYDNEPDKRFEDRMKSDMGDKIYKMRQKQLEFKGKAPMYNKDTQPMDDGIDKVQFDKDKSGWNEREGLKESMITGSYINPLNKRKLMEFRLSEIDFVDVLNENFEMQLNLDGLGNTYMNKSVDTKVIVNEAVVDAMGSHKFFTDGKTVIALKNPVQTLTESEQKEEKAPITEQEKKMKHLLGYKPSEFVNTKNVKHNRGF